MRQKLGGRLEHGTISENDRAITVPGAAKLGEPKIIRIGQPLGQNRAAASTLARVAQSKFL